MMVSRSGILHQRASLISVILLVVFPVVTQAEEISTNLGQMLANLQQTTLGPLWTMLMGACYMLGVVTFCLGMLKLKKFGQMTVFMNTHAEIIGPLLRILVGTLLLYTPFSIDVVINSFWGGSVSNLADPRVCLNGW